jgi:hypothetical protein
MTVTPEAAASAGKAAPNRRPAHWPQPPPPGQLGIIRNALITGSADSRGCRGRGLAWLPWLA